MDSPNIDQITRYQTEQRSTKAGAGGPRDQDSWSATLTCVSIDYTTDMGDLYLNLASQGDPGLRGCLYLWSTRTLALAFNTYTTFDYISL
jgi:hypothetical protein